MGKDPDVTAAILAGGESRRLGGRDKAFVELAGRPMVAHVIERLPPVFTETLVVTRWPDRYHGFSVRTVCDTRSVRSALTGLEAALLASRTPWVFVTACDTPFLHPDLVRLVLSERESGLDIVLPETREGTKPMLALYHIRCLPKIREMLDGKDYKIKRMFLHQVRAILPEARFLAADPDLDSIENVNTPEDLVRAENRFLS